MDPYLEGSEWMSFHSEFCVEIARQLRPFLRPKYTAMTMKYYIMDTPDELAISAYTGSRSGIYADVGVAEVSPAPVAQGAETAIMEPTIEMATVMPQATPQLAIEIRDIEERKLVTLIELLSPANKRGQGYDEYIAKRQRILLSTTHLLEIDLLRRGKRLPMRRALPPAPYFVFLSRYEKRPLTDIWQIELDQPLPTVPVPLLPNDADVPLNLQQAFTQVYDAVGYDLIFNYNRPPDIPIEDN
jgi:hypothetical protein